jgi:hypothetical protein
LEVLIKKGRKTKCGKEREKAWRVEEEEEDEECESE